MKKNFTETQLRQLAAHGWSTPYGRWPSPTARYMIEMIDTYRRKTTTPPKPTKTRSMRRIDTANPTPLFPSEVAQNSKQRYPQSYVEFVRDVVVSNELNQITSASRKEADVRYASTKEAIQLAQPIFIDSLIVLLRYLME